VGLAYAYVYCDETTDHKLVGWCGMRDGNITGPLVLETDAPRLSPVEEEIFDGVIGTANGAFLPIEFSWVNPGTFTLIYEMPYRCNNKSDVYVTTYAEKSLGQIDEILSTSAADEKGAIYYIVETETNYLVAASVPGQTVTTEENGSHARVMFFDVPNIVIRETAWYLKSKAGSHGLKYFSLPNSYRHKTSDRDLVIYTQPYRSDTASANGIEWLIVMVIPAEVVYGKINSLASTAFTVFAIGSLLGVIVSLFMVRALTRAMRTAIINDEGVDLGDSCIAEIRAISDNIRNGNASKGDVLLVDADELMMNGGAGTGGEKKD
jgi:hypothetical protein